MPSNPCGCPYKYSSSRVLISQSLIWFIGPTLNSILIIRQSFRLRGILGFALAAEEFQLEVMEKSLALTIEDFGARVASVWEALRPTTRSLLERALVSSQSSNQFSAGTSLRAVEAPYDARAEWELSRLLAALDERARESGASALNPEQSQELGRMAETCARVLHNAARSAEVMAQLLERALRVHNYASVDLLADTLTSRLAVSEICELARHQNHAVRAIAQEALLQIPTAVLAGLLNDPIDYDVAREVLERQASEYASEEARWIVNSLDRAETDGEEI